MSERYQVFQDCREAAHWLTGHPDRCASEVDGRRIDWRGVHCCGGPWTTVQDEHGPIEPPKPEPQALDWPESLIGAIGTMSGWHPEPEVREATIRAVVAEILAQARRETAAAKGGQA